MASPEYPPFRYHDPSSATLRGLAQQTTGKSADVDLVLGSVSKGHQSAVDAADGILEDPLTGAKLPVKSAGDSVVQHVTFAGGCIDRFADAVDTFDSTSTYPRCITKLNEAWTAGGNDDYGVPAASYNMHMDAAERKSVSDRHATDVKNAKAALAKELQTEHGLLSDQLDTEAGKVADLLKAGPTKEAVKSLWENGNLPPNAALRWPDLGLSVADLPVEQQEAVRDYLVQHPELLTNSPAWVTDAINDLPSDLQLDVQVMQRKQELHEAGLLDDVNTHSPWYDEWIRNTLENDVSLDTVKDIAKTHDITPEDFQVLDDMDGTVDDEGNAIKDNTGKWFFLLPTDISGSDAEKAVLMTYIMNAGTGYRDGKDTDGYGDYEPEDYDADEIQRIIDRQDDNDFSYDDDVDFVHDNGGRLITTPNGMIMGAGGNELQDLYSFSGGTTYGDIFMINEDDLEDPDGRLREIVESGNNPVISDPYSDKDLDRLLHHEERHSQQYAEEGLGGFLSSYLPEAATSGHWEWHDNPGPIPGKHPVWVSDQTENDYEQDAGLSDGNYTADP